MTTEQFERVVADPELRAKNNQLLEDEGWKRLKPDEKVLFVWRPPDMAPDAGLSLHAFEVPFLVDSVERLPSTVIAQVLDLLGAEEKENDPVPFQLSEPLGYLIRSAHTFGPSDEGWCHPPHAKAALARIREAVALLQALNIKCAETNDQTTWQEAEPAGEG